MARPKPKILLEYTDKNFLSEQILDADAIYAVFYKNKPINLKSVNCLSDFGGTKYKKTSFSNPGHAFNLTERLNEKFKTTDFTVRKLTNGDVVQENANKRNNGFFTKRD